MKAPIATIIFSLTFSFSFSQQTLFNNEKAMKHVMGAANMIYSMNMDSATIYIEKTRKMLPKHPVIPMMEGVSVLWKHIPVLTDSIFTEFKLKMLETADAAFRLGEEEPEAIFFEMASRGLLAEYYADRGAYMKAIGEASRAYTLLKKGFDLVEEYPEFLFASGIYNYFREAYPRDNPIVKPFIWFFRSGDIEVGIDQIKQASEKSVISKVEAYVYLGYIYLRYEEEPVKAQKYMKDLLSLYPENLYVQSKYLESLNLPGFFNQLPTHVIDGLIDCDRLYYKIVGNVFKGIYCEKVLGDDDMSFDYYNQAIGMGNALEGHGDHYKSLAYLGAGRILDRGGKEASAESYFQLAVLHAQTDEVLNEARSLLK